MVGTHWNDGDAKGLNCSASISTTCGTNMRTIKLTQGQVTLVDNDTYTWARKFKWYAWKRKSNYSFYVRRGIGGRVDHQKIWLHHCIIGKPLNGLMVDHINGDGLDNTRKNLRIVSSSGNGRNKYKHRNGGLFGARISGKRWRADIVVNGKTVYLGTFATKEQAHTVAIGVSHV
jgi:HNH endonuclease